MADSPQVSTDVDPIHARYVELDESCRRVGTSIPRIIDQAVMIQLWIEDEIGGGVRMQDRNRKKTVTGRLLRELVKGAPAIGILDTPDKITAIREKLEADSEDALAQNELARRESWNDARNKIVD